MVVRIRLARLGCRNHPFYRVIATDSTTTRDGKHLQVLGYYNPTGKKDKQRMSLKLERVKYWLSVGAQPSDPIERLLSQAGSMVAMEHQSDKYLVDAALTAHTLNQDQPANTNLNPNEQDGTTSLEAIFSIGLTVN